MYYIQYSNVCHYLSKYNVVKNFLYNIIFLLFQAKGGRPFKVGDRVRVKASVTTPKYKWGTVNHASIGTVVSVSSNGKDIKVDFEQQANWTGLESEMELVPVRHNGVK
jgi:small-conductance mechanosensitive channel